MGPGPGSVSARILHKLADDARVSGGAQMRDVVITGPAYFGLAERDATRKAGAARRAGDQQRQQDLRDQPHHRAVHRAPGVPGSRGERPEG
ncbi:Hsp70 family protein [Kitasatospora sp. NPDC097605]|uniref:Hsp70 family protein n=1 Tax=Kitasatospora sp. NPDC097605 TaxID=3157226 RepID=UPI0033303365